MLELRASGNDIVEPYVEKFPEAKFFPGRKPWEQKVDIALPPCHTERARRRRRTHACRQRSGNGGRGQQHGLYPEAIDHFIETHHLCPRQGL